MHTSVNGPNDYTEIKAELDHLPIYECTFIYLMHKIMHKNKVSGFA